MHPSKEAREGKYLGCLFKFRLTQSVPFIGFRTKTTTTQEITDKVEDKVTKFQPTTSIHPSQRANFSPKSLKKSLSSKVSPSTPTAAAAPAPATTTTTITRREKLLHFFSLDGKLGRWRNREKLKTHVHFYIRYICIQTYINIYICIRICKDPPAKVFCPLLRRSRSQDWLKSWARTTANQKKKLMFRARTTTANFSNNSVPEFNINGVSYFRSLFLAGFSSIFKGCSS